MAWRRGAIAALAVVVCLAATACGYRSADPEAGATTVTSPATEATASTTETTETTASTTETTETGAAPTETTGTTGSVEVPATDPAPVISAQEIEELERTLDEIDQILADLEEDLAQD